MLSKIQQDLLMDFFAVTGQHSSPLLHEDALIENNGFYIDTILSFEQFDFPIKVLLLRLAISQNNEEFLETLDKIYHMYYTREIDADLKRVLTSLKAINDLKNDAEVRFGEYGSRSAISHYFNRVGECNADGSPMNKQDIIDSLEYVIKNDIEIILNNNSEQRDQIERQVLEKAQLLHASALNTNWRFASNLHYRQLPQFALSQVDISTTVSTTYARAHHIALNHLTFFSELSITQAIELVAGLSSEKIQAITQIVRRIGLQPEMREAFLNFNDEFTQLHGKALIALVTNSHNRLTIQEGLALIRNLSASHLEVIENVCELTGVVENMGDLLRNAQINAENSRCVIRLVTNNHNRITLAEALEVVLNLRFDELDAIRMVSQRAGANLARELANHFKFLQGDPLYNEFSLISFKEYHKLLLVTLLTNDISNLPVDLAVAEIRKFSWNRYSDERSNRVLNYKLYALNAIINRRGVLENITHLVAGWAAPFELIHRQTFIYLMINEANQFISTHAALNTMFAIIRAYSLEGADSGLQVLTTLVQTRNFAPVINLILQELPNASFDEIQCKLFLKLTHEVLGNRWMSRERALEESLKLIREELSDEQLAAVYTQNIKLSMAANFVPKRHLESEESKASTDDNVHKRHRRDDEDDESQHNRFTL